MTAADAGLVGAVRDALASAADPERAPAQQRYMRSDMPFLGMSASTLRSAVRPVLADPSHRLETRGAWEATVRELWDAARFREERYAALVLARLPAYRRWAQDPASMPLYRHLVESGAWWDYVDQIASHLVGPVLRTHPGPEGRRMREWARDEHLWVRRAAILSQLSARRQTDTDLLLDCIEPNLDDPDFFVRKAIGWALRQYAHNGPDAAQWVREVVDAYGQRLSGLSRREALKNLKGPEPES